VDVRVAGHQVDTGESLREHAIARIEDLTEKYFSRAIAANVTFGRGPINDFTCDIMAPVAQGVVLKASHRAQEAQLAFNGAADRIETQLRRYVKRLREHKANGQPYVENAGYTVFSAPQESEDGPSNPAIIAETRVDIPEASVSDAVMLMDLRNTSALMFKNSASGDHNMIYRREDGNIGWVEPRDS
jgi:ribosomal subunit interface protein